MSARLSSTTDAFQSQINTIQEKIKAIDSKIEILDTEVDMEEETVVKTVQQFNKDFLKFTEQLREVDLLKQKYEKSCSDNIAETKKLREITKELAREKSDSKATNDKFKKAEEQLKVMSQSKLKILDIKIREKGRKNDELKSEQENFLQIHPKINVM